MAIDSPEAFPRRGIFEGDITIPKALRVGKAVAAATKLHCPEISPDVIRHPGPKKTKVAHIAWRLCDRQTSIHRLDPASRSTQVEVLKSEVYLFENGDLGSCLMPDGKPVEDEVLNDVTLAQYENEVRAGSLSALFDRNNILIVGRVLNMRAHDIANYVAVRDNSPEAAAMIIGRIAAFAKEGSGPTY